MDKRTIDLLKNAKAILKIAFDREKERYPSLHENKEFVKSAKNLCLITEAMNSIRRIEDVDCG